MVEIGKKYNHLTCLRKDSSRDYRYYIFKCDCGNEKSMIADNIVRGTTTSCGCQRNHSTSKNFTHTKHGGHGTRLYVIWKSMRERCNTKTAWRYADWGGRGIKICEEWDDFTVFREWALANGYNDTLTIDRIDNTKGYSPDNCRWATYKSQNNNRRTNRYIEINGVTHTLAEWSEISGVSYKAIHNRLNNLKWDVAKAIFTPVAKRKGE